MLHHLFPPKWRSRNPAIRAESIAALNDEDPALIDALNREKLPQIRKQIIHRLCDIDLLEQLLDRETDPSTREVIEKTIAKALASGEIAEDKVIAYLNRHDDLELKEYLLTNSATQSIRAEMLQYFDRPALLAKVVLNDKSIEVRLKALEGIKRIPTLNRIINESKGKNKIIVQNARALLQKRHEQEQRPKIQKQLLEEALTLASQQQPDQTRLIKLEEQWQIYHQDAPAKTNEQIRKAIEKARRAIHLANEAKIQLDKQRAILTKILALGEKLKTQGALPSFDIENNKQQRIDLEKSWQALEKELDSAINPALGSQIQEQFHYFDQQMTQVLRDREGHQREIALMNQAKDYANAHHIILERTIRELEQKWKNQHNQPEETETRHFQVLIWQAYERLEDNRKIVDATSKALNQQLDQIQNALSEGNSRSAQSIADKARKHVEILKTQDPKVWRIYQPRYTRLQSQLSEMRDWQRFGSSTARDELIRAMAELQNYDMSVSQLRNEIKKLREQWRALDRASGPASDTLWNMFNDVAERSYKPIKDHYDALKEQQQTNARRREDFCKELQTYFDKLEKTSINYAELSDYIRQKREQWHSLGGVEPAVWKKLRQEFLDSIKPVDALLKNEASNEVGRRERLIKQVQQLAGEENIDEAMTKVKQIQDRWKPSVMSRRNIENRLWREFRQACDQIYQRHEKENEDYRKELQQRTKAKKALNDELQQLIASNPENWNSARKERNDIIARYKAIQSPILKNQTRAIEKRHQLLRRQFDEAEQASKLADYARELGLLLEKALYCDRLEQAIIQGRAAEPSRWHEFTALSPGREEKMQQRFDAFRQAGSANLEENQRLKERLCLEMEVLLDIESPARFIEQRRNWQLEHLSEALTGELGLSTKRKIEDCLLECCALGPVAESATSEIAQRLGSVVKTLTR